LRSQAEADVHRPTIRLATLVSGNAWPPPFDFHQSTNKREQPYVSFVHITSC
jgi:hypothetical protein